MQASNVAPAAFLVGGILVLIIWLAIIALEVVMLWSYGTLLKAALGESKVLVLLLLIPIVNIIMPIVWGLRAHRLLLEREGKV